jgi:hypothetical protein
MLPALLGYEDVVLDRCWLSEPIYGAAFRGGRDRLGAVGRRMLERVTLRCQCAVIVCRPPWDECLKAYRSRKGDEYLETEKQLRDVYDRYASLTTALPCFEHDWTRGGLQEKAAPADEPVAHPIANSGASYSAGNLKAPFVLVGDAFGPVKNDDPLLQLPFVSFSGTECARWLTQQLEDANVSERELLWLNGDDPLLNEIVAAHSRKRTFALGSRASGALHALGIKHLHVPHPQHAKRFNYHGGYRLIKELTKELL